MTHALLALENEPYPQDRRVRQEAEALLAAGYAVTVCAPADPGQAADEHVDGVRVLRYAPPPPGAGIAGYLREYALSLLAIGRLMRRAQRETPVDVAILAAPPDLIVLPALPLRRAGAAIVFDHHDLSPELFALKFGERAAVARVVGAAERFALRRADVVLATNDTYADAQRTRGGVAGERIFVVRNGPDPERIHPVQADPALRHGRAHLVVWAGVMGHHEGLEHVLAAASELAARGRDDIGFALVGDGEARAGLQEEVRRRGLQDAVRFPGMVGDESLRSYLATATVCLNVDEPGPMNDASTMTKVVEYMTMGRPTVQFALRETARVCGDAGRYARPGDAADLAGHVLALVDDPALAADLGRRARTRALEGLLWPDQVGVLLEAVATALRLRRR